MPGSYLLFYVRTYADVPTCGMCLPRERSRSLSRETRTRHLATVRWWWLGNECHIHTFCTVGIGAATMTAVGVHVDYGSWMLLKEYCCTIIILCAVSLLSMTSATCLSACPFPFSNTWLVYNTSLRRPLRSLTKKRTEQNANE